MICGGYWCTESTYCNKTLVNTSSIQSSTTIKVKLTAADTGGSGLNTLQYAWSTSNTTEPTSGWTNFTNGSTISKNDISSAGTYYLWTKVIDKAGNRATNVKTSNAFLVGIVSASDIANSTDKTEFYGAKVTGYSCANSAGVNGWKIFYADSSNIYLIADDYISYDYCPPSATKRIYKNADYRLSFNNVILDYLGSSNITDEKIKALNNEYFTKGYKNSTATHMKALAYMLDTNVWNVYKGDKASYAIGGPTIELLMKSYNQKYGVDYRARVKSSSGYQISKDGGTTWNDSSSSGMLDRNDSLYILNTSSRATGMWIASPSYSGGIGEIMVASFTGGIEYTSYDASDPGFRPLVCLNSDVQLKKNLDGTYAIK